MSKTDAFELNEDHRHWARRRYGRPGSFYLGLIKEQKGKCALTHVLLYFNAKKCGTSSRGGLGPHPLYAAVDHIDPSEKRNEGKVQIVCFAVNDLKGHLPVPLFRALEKTTAWKKFCKKWQATARHTRQRQAFKALIRKGR